MMPTSSLHLPFGLNTGFPTQSSSPTSRNMHYRRRPSSVPLPNGLPIPTPTLTRPLVASLFLPFPHLYRDSCQTLHVSSISRFNQGQGSQQHEQQQSFQFTSVPLSAQFPTESFPSQTPQQDLFRPNPQPALARSWATAMPYSRRPSSRGRG